MSGRPAEALLSHAEAMRLSPHDPVMWGNMASRSMALTLLRRYDEALDWARQALKQPNAAIFARITELAALGLLGRLDEAAVALDRARRLKPDLNLKFVQEVLPISDPDHRTLFADGLRRAGLPD